MEYIQRYAPVTLCVIAGLSAFAIATDPGEAEASRNAAVELPLRAAIHNLGAVTAPACPDAVWPYLNAECVLHPTLETANRPIRRIELDSRDIQARRERLYQLSIGR